jgi:uncharacterized protein (DUF1778 family)
MVKATKKAVNKAPRKQNTSGRVTRSPAPQRRGNAARHERTTAQATARLEARVPSELYEIMKRAAALRGVSLTSYVIDSVGEQALKDIEQITIIRLAMPEQVRFAEALVNPPAPNERLKRAFALRESLITR